MKKSGIILLSIFVVLIALVGVLFGAVFCLRTQHVVFVGENTLKVDKEEIIEAAGLKKGQSIFMIDKDQAISNVEAKYSHIKVIQIKTISLTEIEIKIRARHEMCYAKFNNNYYIMDEEFKVLNIVEMNAEDEESNEPTDLIYIENEFNITTSTKVCDFVGSDYQKSVMIELYNSMITVVTKTEGEGEEAREVYFTRADVCDMLKNIQFEDHNTFNNIIVTTKYGVKLNIENPSKKLQNKINICFSTIKEFLSNTETENKVQSGEIKIYYDMDNNQKCIYIPEVVVP